MARSRKPKADAAPYPPGWEPFLAAINANLDEDTPRLVFADWLQDNGDEARAEFIRLQCAEARGDASSAKRAAALLAKHRDRWLLGLPKGLRDRPNWCVFRRGFIASMTVLGRHWASASGLMNSSAGGKAIRRITALEELRIEQVWANIVESRTLTGLRVLALPSAGSGLIGSLAKSPILPTLTELTIEAKSSDGFAQWSFRDLFASRKLTRLRCLRVESMRLGNLVAVGLVNPRFASLEELRLRHDSLDATGMEALARSPATANLRVLDLLNNQIKDAGLRHLLASPGLRKLEELNLGECQLTPAAARTLADWEGLRSVRSLDLRGNPLRSAEAEIIARSPHAQNLTDLRVGRKAKS
jgi:uncharacterized protein (TIGR02996 family)